MRQARTGLGSNRPAGSPRLRCTDHMLLGGDQPSTQCNAVVVCAAREAGIAGACCSCLPALNLNLHLFLRKKKTLQPPIHPQHNEGSLLKRVTVGFWFLGSVWGRLFLCCLSVSVGKAAWRSLALGPDCASIVGAAVASPTFLSAARIDESTTNICACDCGNDHATRPFKGPRP